VQQASGYFFLSLSSLKKIFSGNRFLYPNTEYWTKIVFPFFPRNS